VSSSNKREREIAREKYERQQQRRLEQEQTRRRRNQIIAAIAGLTVVGGTLAALLINHNANSPATPVTSPTTTASPLPTPSKSVTASPVSLVCPNGPTPTTKHDHWANSPSGTLDASKTYILNLATNCGDIKIQMLQAQAPVTTASEYFLTEKGYYNLSDCFRLTTQGIYVVQCGSPTNNAQNGPGYTVPDENLPVSGSNNYPAGTVAMANAGAGTSGSQFFIVYKDTTLPPSYTIWGKVVSGLDVVTKVAGVGVKGGGADGVPAQPFVITKATTTATG